MEEVGGVFSASGPGGGYAAGYFAGENDPAAANFGGTLAELTDPTALTAHRLYDPYFQDGIQITYDPASGSYVIPMHGTYDSVPSTVAPSDIDPSKADASRT
jgi:hypothetical protein